MTFDLTIGQPLYKFGVVKLGGSIFPGFHPGLLYVQPLHTSGLSVFLISIYVDHRSPLTSYVIVNCPLPAMRSEASGLKMIVYVVFQ